MPYHAQIPMVELIGHRWIRADPRLRPGSAPPILHPDLDGRAGDGGREMHVRWLGR